MNGQCGFTVFRYLQFASSLGSSDRSPRIASQLKHCLGIFFCLWVGCITLRSVEAQQIWEFSPYRVQVWVAYDWSLDLSDLSQDRLRPAINAGLEAVFRSAWAVETLDAPPHLAAPFTRGLEEITLESLAQTEFELLVVKAAEDTNAVRSYEAALERLAAIAITRRDLQVLTFASTAFQNRHPELAKLLSKCTLVFDSTEEIARAIEAKQVLAALLPRSKAKPLESATRPILTALPWQTQHLFRELDKVFFVSIAKSEGQYEVSVRELDCPMRFMGPVMRYRTPFQFMVPACARQAIIAAFAPVTRVEEASLRTAQLTLRSGGLIVDRDNPALLHPGDVLQPIIRRDDRNGIPSLLELLPWTFAAVTKSDGIRIDANVYSGISGALQGRRNRRTQRIALKVRPTSDATDMKVVVRQNSSVPQIGCEIYLRDLATEQLTPLGRTDWRGMIAIPASESSQSFIPEAVRLARAKAEKAAEEEALKKKQPSTDAASQGKSAAPAEAEIQDVPTDLADLEEAIPLRQPLALLYVKSGETVLARLPIVPGLTPMELAELPSDARRLEAEAFLSGFQGEALDLIGLRSLIAARAKHRIKENKPDEAKLLLAELRLLPSYTEMSDDLENLQRKMLDETRGQIPLASKSKIDRMFQTTRDILQKYLQTDLGKEIDRLLDPARQIPIVKPNDAAVSKESEGSQETKGADGK